MSDYKKMDGVDVAEYLKRMGHEPVPHRGVYPDGDLGVAEAIAELMKKNNIPANADLTQFTYSRAQRQALVRGLEELYKNDPNYSQLKAWPVIRDYLKRELGPATDLIVPN